MVATAIGSYYYYYIIIVVAWRTQDGITGRYAITPWKLAGSPDCKTRQYNFTTKEMQSFQTKFDGSGFQMQMGKGVFFEPSRAIVANIPDIGIIPMILEFQIPNPELPYQFHPRLLHLVRILNYPDTIRAAVDFQGRGQCVNGQWSSFNYNGGGGRGWPVIV